MFVPGYLKKFGAPLNFFLPETRYGTIWARKIIPAFQNGAADEAYCDSEEKFCGEVHCDFGKLSKVLGRKKPPILGR